jgi:hypothetical protein
MLRDIGTDIHACGNARRVEASISKEVEDIHEPENTVRVSSDCEVMSVVCLPPSQESCSLGYAHHDNTIVVCLPNARRRGIQDPPVHQSTILLETRLA